MNERLKKQPKKAKNQRSKMGRRNLERLREWIAVCRLPHPSFWYGAFGLMWLCVGHSPRLLSFICLPRFSPRLTLLPPRCLSRLSDMVWVLDVVTCWKILTDGFHNDKKIHSPVGLKKEKKKVVRWVLFFGGGVAVTFQQAPALQIKKILKKKKKSLAAEMFLICWACFSLTRFVVEDCRRFWCSKKSVN